MDKYEHVDIPCTSTESKRGTRAWGRRSELLTQRGLPQLLPSLSCALKPVLLFASHFPKMNPRELVDHIRSGPAKIVLRAPLRFCHQICSNPCDFNEYIQALESSETIRDVECYSYQELGIAEDRLAKTLGSI
jgi:hypothetical protein